MRAADAPVAAATVPMLMQAIADPNGSSRAVAAVVSSDAGLAARVLAVANSASFGMSRQITEIGQAVSMVGSSVCQTLAIAGSCSLLDGDSGLPHVREHSIRVATASRFLAGRAGLSKPDAFAAGLLHDLGEILLWNEQPDVYAAEHATWEDTMQQLRNERALFGRDHALAAREQLAQWQLPGQVVDAVGDHHRPDMDHADLSTAVIAAEELMESDIEWSNRFRLFDLTADDVASVREDLDAAVSEMSGMFASA